MSNLTEIKVKGIPSEEKQKLIIIAKENGFDNLSEFLRNQFKAIADNGVPVDREKPVQLLLNQINKRLDNMTLSLNKNNEIYAIDKDMLKRALGEN